MPFVASTSSPRLGVWLHVLRCVEIMCELYLVGNPPSRAVLLERPSCSLQLHRFRR